MDGTTTERVIGRRYRLESVLGRGGMGVVWAAHDDVLGRPVAVKEVLPAPGLQPAERAAMRTRTVTEARNAARLAAGAAVLVYDVVEEDGEPWIVMERLAPRNLDDVIGERGPLPTHEVAELGLSLLSALDAAHAVGVLHRDVKPSNVMFRGDERMANTVLTDFGVARFAGDPSSTMTGTLIGSPAFVSPERASGAAASPASDLWALGVTLWIATEGTSPFHRDGTLQTLSAVLTAEPPPLLLAGPLAPVLTGLLHKDPAQRLAAPEARHLLERIHGPRPDRRPAIGPRAGAAAAAVTPPAPPEAAAEPVAVPAATPAAAVTPAPASTRVEDDEPDALVPAATTPRHRGRLLVGALALAGLGVAAATQLVGTGGQDQAAASRSAPGSSTKVAPTVPSAPPVTPGAAGGAAAPTPTSGDAAGPSSGAPGPSTAGASAPGASGTSSSGTDASGTGTSASSAATPTSSSSSASAPTSRTSSTSPSDATTTGSSDGGGSGGGAVPAGMHRYTDRTGFSVAVPAGWTTDRKGGRVYLRDPDTSAYLLVDQTTKPAADPVADWRQQEKSVSKRLSNYRLIGIESHRVGSWRGADWEFTHGSGTHVLNRNLVTGPDQAYALYWSAPDRSWSASRRQFEQVTDSFRPRG